MFFKRTPKDKPQPAASGAMPLSAREVPQADGAPEAPVLAQALEAAKPRLAVEPLPVSKLRVSADANSLGFASTADIEASAGLIGQDRALNALAFGAGIRAHDFNMFVLGPPAAGKSSAVKAYLAKIAGAVPTPDDWAYVNNFEDVTRPRAVRLPPGRARPLARAMIRAIDELRQTLPQTFEGEDYQARRKAIDEEFRQSHEGAIEALTREAAQKNIAILRTPMGFGMAPMHDGKVVAPDVFQQLPEAMRAEVQERIAGFEKRLEQILSEAPTLDKTRRKRIETLNEEVARIAIEDALHEVKAEFADVADVMTYLAATEADLVRNAGVFVGGSGGESEVVREPADTSRDPRFRRYMVNVMVASGASEKGAPIVEEDNPTFGNIMGRAEHLAHMGALVTDFLLLKSGALHRANGGYLLIDARKLLLSPFAYEALKRALKAGQIKIEQPAETLGLIATQTIEPEPIPLDVKVILVGERELYYLLSAYDPDFSRLFKVQADFDDTIARTQDTDVAYARLIASIVTTHKLKPVDASGVARLIEEGVRLAEDREKLSLEVGRIADIVREADYWAGVAGRSVVAREDVARAVEENIQRADRLRDRAQEAFDRGIMLVDTDGAKTGQINGLSVLQLGNFAFGRPSRITARVRMGSGRVTDIEREVKLGGPLHSKGVMILWGYLAGQFAEEVPLALAATLVFEQSYGGVDGDSASAAELIVLLSALADAPIKQSLAITGSINQWGEVQAIGGVNEKIEGFFDVCRARGLTGQQGVLIPRSNVQHLMLREDVVEAARGGKFKIYGIGSVAEGLELLTGIAAGERGLDGKFPAGTINRRVEDRLALFAKRAKAFGAYDKEGGSGSGALTS